MFRGISEVFFEGDIQVHFKAWQRKKGFEKVRRSPLFLSQAAARWTWR